MKVSHFVWAMLILVINGCVVIYGAFAITNLLGCYVLGEGGIAGLNELFDLNRTANVCMRDDKTNRIILGIAVLLAMARLLPSRIAMLVRGSPLGRWVESNIGMTSDDDSDEK